MKYTELRELNAIWKQISSMVDDLMGSNELQMVLETSKNFEYWLISPFVKDNGIPMLTWCCADGYPSTKDISCMDWHEMKEIIFELVSSEKVTNYYIESV